MGDPECRAYTVEMESVRLAGDLLKLAHTVIVDTLLDVVPLLDTRGSLTRGVTWHGIPKSLQCLQMGASPL